MVSVLFSLVVLAQTANDVDKEVKGDPSIGSQPREASVNFTFSGSNSQLGRIYRDGSPTTCPTEVYPGIFNEATEYYYEEFVFTNSSGSTVCTTISFNPDLGGNPCGTNAHAIAYLNSYDPGNQGDNYLGDVGSSTAQPFEVDVPAGADLVVVVTNTASAAICDGYFEVDGIGGQAAVPVFSHWGSFLFLGLIALAGLFVMKRRF